MKLIIFWGFLISLNCFASKYLEVKDLGEEESGSFTTSREHSFKVYEGMPALLSTDNVTVKAKVLSFNRNSIVWEMAAQEIPVPFYVDDQVLFQNYEHLLTRQQRFYSKSNINRLLKKREKLKDKIIEKKLSGYNIDINFGSQLSSTYSLVSSDELETTLDFGLNFSYFIPISSRIYFAPGIGVGTGSVSYLGDSYSTSLVEITAEFLFQLNSSPDSETIPYVGVGMGVGLSSTDLEVLKTQGHTISIPRLTAGLLFPTKGSDAGFSTELILDGVSVREDEEGIQNNANKVNLKFALGYQKFFQ